MLCFLHAFNRRPVNNITSLTREIVLKTNTCTWSMVAMWFMIATGVVIVSSCKTTYSSAKYQHQYTCTLHALKRDVCVCCNESIPGIFQVPVIGLCPAATNNVAGAPCITIGN